MKKLISIVTPCYNEEENVEELHDQIKQIMSELPEYDYEHLYIDNASTDGTIPILRRGRGQTGKGHPEYTQLRAYTLAVPRYFTGKRRRGDIDGFGLSGPARPDQGICQEVGRGL